MTVGEMRLSASGIPLYGPGQVDLHQSRSLNGRGLWPTIAVPSGQPNGLPEASTRRVSRWIDSYRWKNHLGGLK